MTKAPYLAFLVVAACGAGPDSAALRSYDLQITHPAPNATFLRIAPGASATRLPKLSQIESPHFSQYLRQRTGCVVNPSYPVTVLGDERMPAAYMVSILCS